MPWPYCSAIEREAPLAARTNPESLKDKWAIARANNEHEQWVLVSPKLTAGSTSPVSIDAAGNDVAFVNASGQMVHDWGTSAGWKGPAPIGGTARAGSPLAEDAAGDACRS